MEFRYKLIVIYPVFLTTILTFYTSLWAQHINVTKNNKTYSQEVRNDSLKRMVELKNFIPGLVYDLRYATINNFTHKKLYKNGKITFVRLPVAKALKEIQTELTSIGYNLKIFDAYRPFHVSKKMWELIHDPRYVADPSKGSGHNRGLALDLTIIDLKTGREVNMGTDFDNFTDSAHHDFQDLPQDVLENRILLKHVMESHGFNALETEWWHYSWPDNRNYEVLDLGFRTLLKPYF